MNMVFGWWDFGLIVLDMWLAGGGGVGQAKTNTSAGVLMLVTIRNATKKVCMSGLRRERFPTNNYGDDISLQH
jgi:hypothetical protein